MSITPTHLAHYEFRVEGCLMEQWAEWFEGLEIAAENGETLLSGPVADLSALYGLLRKVRDRVYRWFRIIESLFIYQKRNKP